MAGEMWSMPGQVVGLGREGDMAELLGRAAPPQGRATLARQAWARPSRLGVMEALGYMSWTCHKHVSGPRL